MQKVIRKSLILLLAIAVTVTFTPMFSFSNAFAATKIKAPQTFYGAAPSAKAIKLTWSKSKGAKKYVVYKNNKVLKTVGKTSFIDKDVKKGKTYKYKVKAMKGKKSSPATYTIKIKAKKGANATKVKLDKTKIDLGIGESATLKAKLTPAKAVKGIVWTSSNKSIATVKAGKVTAKKVGTATITARAASGKTAKCQVTVKEPGPEVAAPTGTYVGHEVDGIQEFLGIRYADPAERWKPAPDVSTTAKDRIVCDEWGPCCIQPYDEVEIASQGELSDDCLNLNIWTKDVNTKNKPVLIFVHGGGYMNGGAHDPLYEGDNFIKNVPNGEDAIFVSINYRTNIFGSIDLSQMDGYTDEYADAVNLWLVDQIQAIKWVSENIEAFGGDPKNITVSGQSCGGMTGFYLLSKPETHKYFQKVIIDSGSPFICQLSQERKREDAQAAFGALGINSINEFLALSNDELKEKIGPVFGAVGVPQDIYADGKIIPKDWWDRIRAGSGNDLKILIGCTTGEGDTMAYDYPNYPNAVDDPAIVWDRIKSTMAKKGGATTKYLIDPVDDEGNPTFDLDAFLATDDNKVRAMTDVYNFATYIQGDEYLAEEVCDATDIYLYIWKYAPDPAKVMEYCDSVDAGGEVSPFGRALHCMDLIFAFDNAEDGYIELSGNPADHPANLAKQMWSVWYYFCKNGDPNNELIPQWNTYSKTDREIMMIDEEWALEKDPRKEQREIYNVRPTGEAVASEIYTNGKIYTVEGEDWDKKPQEAMAVAADGSILAVGTNDSVSTFKGESTTITDLDGKAVFPGFVDSHVHPPGKAMTELFEISCYGLNHKEDTLAAVKEFVDAHPDIDEYYGNGFNMGIIDVANDIPRQWLDEICADKPIVLGSYDGHSRWLNTKALELCNITKDTEATTGGRIQIGPDGEPNGILTDCSGLVTLHAVYTDDQYRQGVAAFSETMNKWGYTACSTGGIGTMKQAVDMDKEGLLTMRINFSSGLDPDDIDGSVAEMLENAEYCKGAPDVKVGAMKFFCDGVVEGATAYLLEPYTEGAGMGEGWTSEPKISEEAMKEAMLKVTDAGFQIHVHAIGDAAVRQTLNSIEYAQKNTKRTDGDFRSAITHLQLVSEQDKPRFGELGVISIFQPYWFLKEPWWYDPIDKLVLGEDRAYTEYPAKSLIDNGATPTASGDYPVSEENNPFLAIEAGVTRNLNSGDYYGVEEITDIDDPTWLLNPAERMPVKTLVEAYTINGAYQMFEEDTIGSLKAGKRADFIILDQDLITINPLKIDSTKVLETYKDGKKVSEYTE